MKDRQLARLLAGLMAAGVLTACGGGGGNPGLCDGSPAVCGEADAGTTTTSSTGTTNSTGTGSSAVGLAPNDTTFTNGNGY
jgi:hypothetical protein